MRTRYVNLRGFTGRAGEPLLSSFDVVDGRFADPEPGASPDRVVDLQGAFVSPAFVDAHCHPDLVAGILNQVPCVPPAVSSIDEMVERLRESPAAQSGEGWILGWGYDESLLSDGRSPSRHDLDRVSTTQPVMIRRSDCHTVCVNTAALRLAGVTAETPDPAGGRIGREGSGEPDGIFSEAPALAVIEAALPKGGADDAVKTLLPLQAHYCERGILAVTDMMGHRTGGADDSLFRWREAEAAGLSVDCLFYAIWTGGEDPFGMPEMTPEETTGRSRYVGVKLFADGSISGRTAAVREPYKFELGEQPENPCGTMTLSEPVYRAAAAYARRNGLQVSIHVMGDRSIDAILSWLEDEPGEWVKGAPSIRLEHVTLLRPEHLEKMKSLRVKPALTTQPIFPFAEWRSYHANLTKSVFADCYRIKTIADAVDAFALSSDAPATTWADPDQVFTSIYAAVTRLDSDGGAFNSDEAVDPATALSLYTSRAVKVMPIEGYGRIAAGEPAHFIAMTGSPLEIAPENLDRIRTAAVWRSGELIWTASAFRSHDR